MTVAPTVPVALTVAAVAASPLAVTATVPVALTRLAVLAVATVLAGLAGAGVQYVLVVAEQRLVRIAGLLGPGSVRAVLAALLLPVPAILGGAGVADVLVVAEQGLVRIARRLRPAGFLPVFTPFLALFAVLGRLGAFFAAFFPALLPVFLPFLAARARSLGPVAAFLAAVLAGGAAAPPGRVRRPGPGP